MKFYKAFLSITFTVMLIMSCGKNPESLLEEAKSKFSVGGISYKTEAHFPVPDTKIINKTFYETNLHFDDSGDLGYHFLQKKDDKDIIYENGELKIMYHNQKRTQILQPKHFKDYNQFITVSNAQFIRKKWSPLGLLKHEWSYEKDSIIENTNLKNYKRVVFDSVVDGVAVRTEQHIFINSDAFLTRFERRNFQDGKNSQTLTFLYSDYKQEDNTQPFNYQIPNSYSTQYGIITKKIKKLNEGDLVPKFASKTMKGKLIDNKHFEGKKYLLNFSVINCGNCKLSLDYMNQESYTYNSEIPMIYINPEDNSDSMKVYMEDINVPFPIITNAKEIAENFGVNSYPRFFLVNEKGIIEDIQIGYSKEFLDKFKI